MYASRFLRQAASRVSSAAAVSAPTLTRPPRAYRPRKAVLKLTPRAIDRLKALTDGPEPRLLRVGVKHKGCAGQAYALDYVTEVGKFDEEVVQDGVKVIVANNALLTVIGSEVDWVEDALSAQFIFRNPNVKDSCGCGMSFSTAE